MAVSRALAGVRVLLVEDHADTRNVLVALLAAHGARVVAAVTAQEALDYLQGDSADIIVCDIRLPGVPGHNLIRTLRSRPPDKGGNTPAIALTAFASSQDERTATAAGFSSYLRKPAGSELIQAIAAALGR
jgi:CheY-like chemotaxis protein